jgi:hypothetical protein
VVEHLSKRWRRGEGREGEPGGRKGRRAREKGGGRGDRERKRGRKEEGEGREARREKERERESARESAGAAERCYRGLLMALPHHDRSQSHSSFPSHCLALHKLELATVLRER